MRIAGLLFALLALLSACGSPGPATSTTAPSAAPVKAGAAASSDPAPATGATGAISVSVSMGFIPDVQFAPFYVAQAKGYYAEEGLNVEIRHSFFQEALVQIAQGQLTFASASGDEILLARAQQIPIKLVFQTYQKYPIAIFSKQQQNITNPSDLLGKTVGVPARSGATYIGLLGVLYAEDLSQQEVEIVEIGFTQAEAVRTDQVPVAVGYFNNEPLQLQSSGVPVNVLRVSDYISLVSNGVVASEETITNNPDLVQRFNRATARGLQDTLDDPDGAFDLSLQFIPELPAERQPQEREKLKQTLELWRSEATEANGLGYSDPQQWETTHRFLRDSNLLSTDVDVTQAFTNDLLP